MNSTFLVLVTFYGFEYLLNEKLDLVFLSAKLSETLRSRSAVFKNARVLVFLALLTKALVLGKVFILSFQS